MVELPMRKLAVFALTPCSSTAFAARAPLPDELMQARTVDIQNYSGQAGWADGCYGELQEWARFKVVSNPKDADLVFRLSYGVRRGRAALDVIQASTGKMLWSDTSALEHWVGGERAERVYRRAGTCRRNTCQMIPKNPALRTEASKQLKPPNTTPPVLDSLCAFLHFAKMYKPNLAVELVEIQGLVGRFLHDCVSGRADFCALR
jgi:hypothetical protein